MLLLAVLLDASRDFLLPGEGVEELAGGGEQRCCCRQSKHGVLLGLGLQVLEKLFHQVSFWVGGLIKGEVFYATSAVLG